MSFKYAHLGLVAGGALLSTLGVRIVRSKEAKKLYSYATAAVIREKNHIMDFVTDVQEDCSDIYADAKDINERYAEEDERIIEDRAEKRKVREAEKAAKKAEKAAEAAPAAV